MMAPPPLPAPYPAVALNKYSMKDAKLETTTDISGAKTCEN